MNQSCVFTNALWNVSEEIFSDYKNRLVSIRSERNLLSNEIGAIKLNLDLFEKERRGIKNKIGEKNKKVEILNKKLNKINVGIQSCESDLADVKNFSFS